MKKAIHVVKGKIENLKRVATSTENSMVTFIVGGTPCKAFGKGAETLVRWMQFDPNSAGEFEGYFDRRSERFGREFVAVHGKPIETETLLNADRPVIVTSEAGAPKAKSAGAPSTPIESIPAATKSVERNANLLIKALPTNQTPGPPASASLQFIDTAPVKQVTFEDLENEYKLQQMKRQMERTNQKNMMH